MVFYKVIRLLSGAKSKSNPANLRLSPTTACMSGDVGSIQIVSYLTLGHFSSFEAIEQ